VVQDDEPVGLDGVQVCVDDGRVVCGAGIAVVATLALRLAIEALAGDVVRLRRDRPGAANAGRKLMALIYAMVLGADSIDDTGVLRAGQTGRLLGGWIPAPVNVGNVSALVDVRACPSARQAARRVDSAGVEGGRRPGRRAAGDRCRQLRRRGLRPAQAERRLRLHPAAGLSPDPHHPRGQPRDVAHPPQEGIGEHAEGDQALHRRADRARGPLRRDRRQAAARRLRALEHEDGDRSLARGSCDPPCRSLGGLQRMQPQVLSLGVERVRQCVAVGRALGAEQRHEEIQHAPSRRHRTCPQCRGRDAIALSVRRPPDR
jgi:hypothetical protein